MTQKKVFPTLDLDSNPEMSLTIKYFGKDYSVFLDTATLMPVAEQTKLKLVFSGETN